MKTITLCADDFALNTPISLAIINLIDAKRISATSCMSNMPAWSKTAKLLHSHIKHIDIGLHFNLSNPLWQTIIKSNLRLINRKQIASELNRQLDQFENELNRQPDFIDGHQHIHQLPIISDILLEICDKRYINKPYIRAINIINKIGNTKFKATIIKLISDWSFTKKLTNKNIRYNTSFSGAYNFSSFKQHNYYQQLFPKFLQQIKDGGIIMCHPGLINKKNSDSISNNRLCEYNYLLSEQFLLDCQQAKTVIGRFSSAAKHK